MQTVDFRYFPLDSGDVVLDLGCGEGRHVISAYIEGNVQSVGVDLSLDDLQTTREKFEDFNEPDNAAKSFKLSCANALALPFANNSFDKVICSEVLEHIPDYQGALREIERVLKPGGLFCASVPRTWPEKICWVLSDAYHQVVGGHLRIFRARTLRGEIESLGFDHLHRHWAHALHTPYWWLQCLVWDNKEKNWWVAQYHRFLVWDLMDRPVFTRVLERLLNPTMGKSVVMYFRKEALS